MSISRVLYVNHFCQSLGGSNLIRSITCPAITVYFHSVSWYSFTRLTESTWSKQRGSVVFLITKPNNKFKFFFLGFFTRETLALFLSKALLFTSGTLVNNCLFQPGIYLYIYYIPYRGRKHHEREEERERKRKRAPPPPRESLSLSLCAAIVWRKSKAREWWTWQSTLNWGRGWE